MSHYPEEVWTDWVRGIAPSEVRAEIHEHVASGCAECRSVLATWEAVAKLARRERDYEPPASVVESAVALYRRYPPTRSPLPKTTRVAELVFDSIQNPLPMGVRGLERATRHLSYKAGSYFVDVRIEEADSPGLASVVGQLMHHPDASSQSLEGLVVLLTSGRTMLAETTTNRFGEFVLEMDTRKENQLAIGVGDEFTVIVPLDRRRRDH